MPNFSHAHRANFLSAVRIAIGNAQLDDVAEWAFAEAEANGFEVAHIPPDGNTAEHSSTSWTDRTIYLSPLGPPGHARLWDLLHEIGHVLQGAPRAGYRAERSSECYAREWDAWTRGWQRATGVHAHLAAHDAEFWAHAKDQAATYEPVA
jgi:hypothetical protein